jgi:hypothetical protein
MDRRDFLRLEAVVWQATMKSCPTRWASVMEANTRSTQDSLAE